MPMTEMMTLLFVGTFSKQWPELSAIVLRNFSILYLVQLSTFRSTYVIILEVHHSLLGCIPSSKALCRKIQELYVRIVAIGQSSMYYVNTYKQVTQYHYIK